MALNIPLPVQMSQQPGGLSGEINQLMRENIENKINRIKAQYLPLKTQAQAMSQMAYAKLLGPQFIAKMMSNPDIISQFSEADQKALLGLTQNAAMQQGQSGNAMNQMPGQEPSFGDKAQNALSNFFFKKNNGEQPQAPRNAFAAPPPYQAPQGPSTAPINQAYQNAEQNGYAVPETDVSKLAAPGSPIAAPTPQVNPNAYSNASPEQQKMVVPNATPEPVDNRTWPQKAGEHRGTIAEETEKGKGRGKAVNEAAKALKIDTELDNANNGMNRVIANPTFRAMKSNPLAGKYDLAYYSKAGTDEQKELVGEFRSYQGKLVQAATKGFGGQFRISEMPSIERLKPQEYDLIGVMVGKQKAGSVLVKAQKQFDYRVAELMDKKHIPEYEAANIASKEINWKKLNDDVNSILDKSEAEVKGSPGASLLVKRDGISYVPVTDGKGKDLLIPEKNYAGFIAKHSQFTRQSAK